MFEQSLAIDPTAEVRAARGGAAGWVLAREEPTPYDAGRVEPVEPVDSGDPFPSGAELGGRASSSLDPRPLDLVSADRPASSLAADAADRLAATPGSPLAAAVVGLQAAVEALAAVDVGGEVAGVLGDAALVMQDARTRIDGRMIAAVGAFEDADGHAADGSASAGTWLAHRSNLSFGRARDLHVAARRLAHLPAVDEALNSGDLSLDHVLVITRMMSSAERIMMFAEHDEAVRDLALAASSVSALRHHLGVLGEQVDPDGSDADPADPGHAVGQHPDRRLHHSSSFEGLGLLDGVLDPLVREKLEVALEAFMELDDSSVPVESWRSAEQRRHDAFHAILDAALTSAATGTVQGARVHVGIVLDIAELLGIDADDPSAPRLVAELADQLGVDLPVGPDSDVEPIDCIPGAGEPAEDDLAEEGEGAAGTVVDARGEGGGEHDPARDACADLERGDTRSGLRRPARYSSGNTIHPAHVRELLQRATIYAVLTLGPWRPINVGSKHRVLPAWLRVVLAAMHQRCRGPGCDRPASWTQAAHGEAWHEGHTTRLDDTLPLCSLHHKLLDVMGWTAELDDRTGIVTWAAPDGRGFSDHPDAWAAPDP